MIYPHTFYIETYGCTFNQGDSEKIARIFIQSKFLPTSLSHAEIIVLNTCAVKSQTEAKIMHRIKSLDLQPKQKLLITGCLPWISERNASEIVKLNKNLWGVLGTNSYKELEIILNSNPLPRYVGIVRKQNRELKSKTIPWRLQKFSPGIVQISEGCDLSCTYCCTQISRGNSVSFPLVDILDQIQLHINNNVKEVYLTSQDCGFYSWNSINIVDLIQKIDKKFGKEDILVRLGMINPIVPSRIINIARLIERSPIFYKFLHIPIQSASDYILRLMRRGYSSSQLHKLFQYFETTKIIISTDVICGFPGEREKDFEITFNFLKKFKPDIVNISKFTPRPGTKAKKMKQIDSKIIKNRSYLLSTLYAEYIAEKNGNWKGWRGKAVVHTYQPDKKFPYSCRNEFYKAVVLPNANLNTIVPVEIIDSSRHFLIGRIINN